MHCTHLGKGTRGKVVVLGAMDAIAHVVFFVDAHCVSIFGARHKAPSPMQEQLVVVRAHCRRQHGPGRAKYTYKI